MPSHQATHNPRLCTCGTQIPAQTYLCSTCAQRLRKQHISRQLPSPPSKSSITTPHHHQRSSRPSPNPLPLPGQNSYANEALNESRASEPSATSIFPASMHQRSSSSGRSSRTDPRRYDSLESAVPSSSSSRTSSSSSSRASADLGYRSPSMRPGPPSSRAPAIDDSAYAPIAAGFARLGLNDRRSSSVGSRRRPSPSDNPRPSYDLNARMFSGA